MGHGLSIGTWMPAQAQADTLSYETFFGLREKPFGLNSDPRFLFHSPSHAATFDALLRGIRRREGLLVLTGEIGIGKTTLCRAVLRSLGRKTYSSFVPDPFASREDLLKMLLVDFGVMSIQDLVTGPLRHASRAELGLLLAGFVDSLGALDAYVVVVIDEAQNMSLPLIEETRILSDSFASKGHLQIVFVGQPELYDKLALPEMRQVDQRVSGYIRLEPLDQDAVAGYLQHRILVAGGSRDRLLFAPDTIGVVHQRSGGVPRLINRICDRALSVACHRRAPIVDCEILAIALSEIGPTTLTPAWTSKETGDAQDGRAVVAPSTATFAPGSPAPAGSTVNPRGAASVDEDDDRFSRRVDEWLSRHDSIPAFRGEPTLSGFDTEKAEGTGTSATKASLARRAQALRKRRSMSRWGDSHGELRGETYMQRLGRLWARRSIIAAMGVLALNVVFMGASRLSNELSGLVEDSPPPESSAPATATAASPLPVAAAPSAAPPTDEMADTPGVESRSVTRRAGDGDTRATSSGYLVAVGVFSSRERADRLVTVLAEAGLPARQRPFELRTRRLQQVLLGPFASRSDAESHLTRLRQLGGYDDAHVIVGDGEAGVSQVSADHRTW